MIPLKLELKNFMAYRDPDPLDLSGLHVVCLTGDNGAGKSTLLDAITWAIWGQARAKRDDELFAQGTAEMRVALTFSEGREVYQVVRVRKLGKAVKGKAATSSGQLDFFVKDVAQNGWRQISEPRSAETQSKIERALNLSYETFVNSAYLKQGRADEFTLKPPGQRKELLGEILSLNLWVEYENIVKDRMAVIEREISKLEADVRVAEEDLQRLPEYERQLGEAQSALRDAEARLRAAEAEQREHDLQRERMQQIRAQLTQTEMRMRALDGESAKLETELRQHETSLAEYQQAVAAQAEIESGFQALQDARALSESLTGKLTSMVELNARKTGAESTIADARRQLESARDAAQRALDEAKREADAGDAATRLQAITRAERKPDRASAEISTTGRATPERFGSAGRGARAERCAQTRDERDQTAHDRAGCNRRNLPGLRASAG